MEVTASPKTLTRLLVVDDDLAILKLYDEALRGAGFDVLSAATGADALAKLADVDGDVAVLLVDFGLPDCDGSDLVKQIAEKYGPKATMYISGWTDEFWQMDAAPGRWILMRKPLSIPKLLAAVNWLAHGGERPKELDEP